MRTVRPTSTGKGPFTLTAAAVGPKAKGFVADTDAEDNSANTYLDRVRAYVPVEIIAFFIFVNAMVGGSDSERSNLAAATGSAAAALTADDWVAVLALAIGAVGAVVYSKVATAKNSQVNVWVVHATVSVIAFLIWTYAMGAKGYAVLDIDVFPSVSGLLLGTFTIFSGLIVPTTSDA